MSDNKENSGDLNSGDLNSGYFNSGNGNSGYFNSGNWNSGNRNSGYFNSGNGNSGDLNSGNFNSGNGNSGYFCIESPPVTFFDSPIEGVSHDDAIDLIPRIDLPISCEWVSESEMTDSEKTENCNYKTVGGYLRKIHTSIQEAFPKAWGKMSKEERQRWLDLPNFNAEKFLACTGVDVRLENTEANINPPTKVEIDGILYNLTKATTA